VVEVIVTAVETLFSICYMRVVVFVAAAVIRILDTFLDLYAYEFVL
jgi:hypothetical protein